MFLLDSQPPNPNSYEISPSSFYWGHRFEPCLLSPCLIEAFPFLKSRWQSIGFYAFWAAGRLLHITFVSQSCCNKLPQTVWLKQQNVILEVL